MANYFLVHDAERFHDLIAPALAESAVRRNFAACRNVCVQLSGDMTAFAARYRIRLDDCIWPRVHNGLGYGRHLWTALAGELLLFAAAEVPEITTAPEELARLLEDHE